MIPSKHLRAKYSRAHTHTQTEAMHLSAATVCEPNDYGPENNWMYNTRWYNDFDADKCINKRTRRDQRRTLANRERASESGRARIKQNYYGISFWPCTFGFLSPVNVVWSDGCTHTLSTRACLIFTARFGAFQFCESVRHRAPPLISPRLRLTNNLAIMCCRFPWFYPIVFRFFFALSLSRRNILPPAATPSHITHSVRRYTIAKIARTEKAPHSGRIRRRNER